MTEVGTKDKELAELVVSQNAVFEAFANQDANLRETFQLLPDTLKTTELCAREVGSARHAARSDAADLRPGVRALAPRTARDAGLRTRDDPPIRDQVRPFTRDARARREGAAPRGPRPRQDHAAAREELRRDQHAPERARLQPAGHRRGLPVLGAMAEPHRRIRLLDPGRSRPVRRGIIFTDCIALGALEATRKIDNQLGTLIDLSNFATKQEACG